MSVRIKSLSPPFRLIRVYDLRGSFACTVNNIRGQVVPHMKMLINNEERVKVLACEWKNDTGNCTMKKVNGMYSNISYKFIFPVKQRKNKRFDASTYKFNLNIIS